MLVNNIEKYKEGITMVVAIDGPAGSGKSTIAKLIAEKLSIEFLNSGSFYRGVTYHCLKNNISLPAM